MFKLLKTGILLARAVLPPWYGLDNPLIQPEIQDDKRVRQNLWIVLVIGGLTLLIGTIYAIQSISEHGEINSDLSLNLMLIGLLGLVVMGIWLHGRMVVAIHSRTAHLLTTYQVREQGDADCLLNVLGWQMFPALRQLIIIHIGGILVSVAYLLFWPVYAAALIPFGVLQLLFVVSEAALILVIALRAYQQHGAFHKSLRTLYLSRVLITIILTYSLSVIWLAQLNAEGEFEGYMVVNLFLMSTVASLVLALIAEWLPVALPLPVLLIVLLTIALDENPDTKVSEGEFVLLYFSILIAVILAYVVVPLILLAHNHQRLLQQPESGE